MTQDLPSPDSVPGEMGRLRCNWRSAPFGLSQLTKVASAFREHVDWGDVVALQAPMGTGKTTFVSALVNVIGAVDAASSPTFALCQEYPMTEGNRIVRHLDLYRIEHESELTNLGWDELMDDPMALTLVEWPERAADHFPEHAMLLRIELQPDGLRLASLWVRESV